MTFGTYDFDDRNWSSAVGKTAFHAGIDVKLCATAAAGLREGRNLAADRQTRIAMSGRVTHFFNSFAEQSGAWAVSIVLTFLGLFSARIVESIKFALNRADVRVKYFEKMATEISHFVFIINRLTLVYHGSTWASPEDKDAIATEYNTVMNAISRNEYVYLSWLRHYWGKNTANAFSRYMEKVRAVDLVLIRMNEAGDQKDKLLPELRSAFDGLKEAALGLLQATV